MPRRSRAWDCATGNGQAARDLARHFDAIVATDASASQLAHAVRADRVAYARATAEASGLRSRSMDAVTVAQALHWFDFDAFYAEVRRVTVPGGVLAAWSYGNCHAGEDVEPLLRELEYDTVGPYWDQRRQLIEDRYRSIPFPFQEIVAPAMELRMTWTLPQLGRYLDSWSAVAAYRRATGEDPVAPMLERIAYHWREVHRPRVVTWPLSFRVGRIT